MKKIKNGLVAFAFILGSLPTFAQTSNPATTKPNQTPPPVSPSTDPSLGKTAPTNQTTGNPTRTDSVGTTPKQGTSILTAPGTRNPDTATTQSAASKKKRKPRKH